MWNFPSPLDGKSDLTPIAGPEAVSARIQRSSKMSGTPKSPKWSSGSSSDDNQCYRGKEEVGVMVTRFEERTKAKSEEAENWRPQGTDFMAKPKADKKFEHLRSIMAEGNQHVEIISRLRFQMQDYVPSIRNSVHLDPSEIKKLCNRLLEAISKIGKLEKGFTDELDILKGLQEEVKKQDPTGNEEYLKNRETSFRKSDKIKMAEKYLEANFADYMDFLYTFIDTPVANLDSQTEDAKSFGRRVRDEMFKKLKAEEDAAKAAMLTQQVPVVQPQQPVQQQPSISNASASNVSTISKKSATEAWEIESQQDTDARLNNYTSVEKEARVNFVYKNIQDQFNDWKATTPEEHEWSQMDDTDLMSQEKSAVAFAPWLDQAAYELEKCKANMIVWDGFLGILTFYDDLMVTMYSYYAMIHPNDPTSIKMRNGDTEEVQRYIKYTQIWMSDKPDKIFRSQGNLSRRKRAALRQSTIQSNQSSQGTGRQPAGRGQSATPNPQPVGSRVNNLLPHQQRGVSSNVYQSSQVTLNNTQYDPTFSMGMNLDMLQGRLGPKFGEYVMRNTPPKNPGVDLDPYLKCLENDVNYVQAQVDRSIRYEKVEPYPGKYDGSRDTDQFLQWFDSEVLRKPHLGWQKKYQILRSNSHGAALDIVVGCASNFNGLKSAVLNINMIFGTRKTMNHSTALDALKNLPPIDDKCIVGIRKAFIVMRSFVSTVRHFDFDEGNMWEMAQREIKWTPDTLVRFHQHLTAIGMVHPDFVCTLDYIWTVIERHKEIRDLSQTKSRRAQALQVDHNQPSLADGACAQVQCGQSSSADSAESGQEEGEPLVPGNSREDQSDSDMVFKNEQACWGKGGSRPPRKQGTQAKFNDTPKRASGGPCKNCKKIGHSAQSCWGWKDMSGDDAFNRAREVGICTKCLSQNHTHENCDLKPEQRILCNVCSKGGHPWQMCRKRQATERARVSKKHKRSKLKETVMSLMQFFDKDSDSGEESEEEVKETTGDTRLVSNLLCSNMRVKGRYPRRIYRPSVAKPGGSGRLVHGSVSEAQWAGDEAKSPPDVLRAGVEDGEVFRTTKTKKASKYAFGPHELKAQNSFHRVLPVILYDKNGKEVQVNCLMDEGSSVSLVSRKVAKLLDHPYEPQKLTLTGVNTPVQNNSRYFEVTARGLHRFSEVQLYVNSWDLELKMSENHVSNMIDLHHDYPYLWQEKVDVPFNKVDVDVLIGFNNPVAMRCQDNLDLPLDGPVVRDSVLGKGVLYSPKMFEKPLESQSSTIEEALAHFARDEVKISRDAWQGLRRDDLEMDLAKAQGNKILSEDAMETTRQFEKTLTRLEDGSVQLGIPWRDGFPGKMQCNYKPMLQIQEKFDEKSKKLEGGKEEVKQFVKDYLEKGFLKRVEEDPATGYYMATFLVAQPNSESTPLRTVIHCSQVFNGRSLNCAMRTGPNLLNKIVSVLLHQRFGKFLCGADISKMFLRIKLRPSDRKYFRILVNGEAFEFQTLPFGVRAAPAMANYVVRYLLEQKLTKETVDRVLRTSYVDDVNMVSDDEQELLEVAKAVIEALEAGGMPCAKMITNSDLIMSNFDKAKFSVTMRMDARDDETFDPGEGVIAKALGLKLNITTDEYSYQEVDTSLKGHTKRHYSSKIASIFDVHGFAGPATIKGRRALSRLNALQSNVNGSKACLAAFLEYFEVRALGRTKAEREKTIRDQMNELMGEIPCDKCKKQEHDPWTCSHFKQCDIVEKWAYLFKCQVCTRCLKFGHFSTSCPSTEKCKKKGCQLNHNTLLHGDTIHWDSDLTQLTLQSAKDIVKEMSEFCVESGKINLIRFPRYIPGFDKETAMLLMFSDGSSEAYGAVAYLRIPDPGGTHPFKTYLIMSKSRVMPLNKRTIPQSELLGATLGAHMVEYLSAELGVKNVRFFTDAKVLMYWLANPSKEQPVFVRNRIVTITNITGGMAWLHIPTDQNPADICTRGQPGDVLSENVLYWHGPSMVWDHESNWTGLKLPTQVVNEQMYFMSSLNNVKKISTIKVNQDGTLNPEGTHEDAYLICSNPVAMIHEAFLMADEFIEAPYQGKSWAELVRNETFDPKPDPKHWRELFKKRKVKHIEPHVLAAGYVRGIRILQALAFRQEFTHWAEKGEMPASWKQKPVYMDIDGIIRQRTRLDQMPEEVQQKAPSLFPWAFRVPKAFKVPIVIPKGYLSNSLMTQEHENSDHDRGLALDVEVNMKYIGPGVRTGSRAAVKQCAACNAGYGKAKPQKMGQVYEQQGSDLKPFRCSSIDVAGPWNVKTGRGTRNNPGTKKMYVLVVGCTNTGAVTLEVMDALDTDAVLTALATIAARFSNFKTLHADNAGSFKQIASEVDLEVIEHEAQPFLEEIKFSSPRDHEGNGYGERMVRLTKEALRATPFDFLAKDSKFKLAIRLCENKINSRPVYIEKNKDSWTVITPSHFLREKLGGKFTEVRAPSGLVDRLAEVDGFVDYFREAWSLIYRKSVRTFPKWAEEAVNLKAGQYVVLVTENCKRDNWPLACVEAVKLDKDGLVRNVLIKETEGNHQSKWRNVRYLVPVQFFKEEKL